MRFAADGTWQHGCCLATESSLDRVPLLRHGILLNCRADNCLQAGTVRTLSDRGPWVAKFVRKPSRTGRRHNLSPLWSTRQLPSLSLFRASRGQLSSTCCPSGRCPRDEQCFVSAAFQPRTPLPAPSPRSRPELRLSIAHRLVLVQKRTTDPSEPHSVDSRAAATDQDRCWCRCTSRRT